MKVGGATYRVVDKVMVRRNNYGRGIFNGDIGIGVGVDRESGVIAAEFDERVVDFYAQDAGELLTHAYAISIHKSQDAEYPVVVIVLLKDHYLLLHRQLLYTVVTRAKQACVLIADWKAIGMAVRNSQPTMHNSGLAERLRQEARQPIQAALNTAPR